MNSMLYSVLVVGSSLLLSLGIAFIYLSLGVDIASLYVSITANMVGFLFLWISFSDGIKEWEAINTFGVLISLVMFFVANVCILL